MQPSFTCDGAGSIPTVSWIDVPAETKTFAIVVDDPNAPGGKFTHWLAWNIPGDRRSTADVAAAATTVEGRNGAGKVGWMAPCPPPEDNAHRYRFHVYALDRELALSAGADREALEAAMKGHVLAEGEVIGRYERPEAARPSGT